MSEKAIFLDRDDTLIEDPGYISDPDQVKLLDGVPEALIALKSLGYKLIIVTNQSAVARGIITEKKLEEIHDRLKQLLAKKNAYIDNIYYCPYHPEGTIKKYTKESNCRKPNPGMLLRAFAEMKIDLEQSWCIGNSNKDIEAGQKAGCKTILIDAPYLNKSKDSTGTNNAIKPDYKAVNIKEAVNIIKKYLRTGRDTKKKDNEPAPKTIMEDEPDSNEMEINTESNPVAQEQQQIIQPPENNEQSDNNEQEIEESIQEESINNNQEKKKRFKKQISNDEPQDSESINDKTEILLKDIVTQLKKMQREDMFSEFSIMRLMAGILQILVLFCLLIALWFIMSSGREASSVFIALGFAIVLQLMALTFFVMQDRK